MNTTPGTQPFRVLPKFADVFDDDETVETLPATPGTPVRAQPTFGFGSKGASKPWAASCED